MIVFFIKVMFSYLKLIFYYVRTNKYQWIKDVWYSKSTIITQSISTFSSTSTTGSSLTTPNSLSPFQKNSSQSVSPTESKNSRSHPLILRTERSNIRRRQNCPTLIVILTANKLTISSRWSSWKVKRKRSATRWTSTSASTRVWTTSATNQSEFKITTANPRRTKSTNSPNNLKKKISSTWTSNQRRPL